MPVLSSNDVNSICRSQSNINLRIAILRLLLVEQIENDKLMNAVRAIRNVVEQADELNKQGTVAIDITDDKPKN